jgi:hypothetical protein
MQSIVLQRTGVGVTRPGRLDDFAPSNTSIQVNVVGTVTYTVETTLDDPNNLANPVLPANMVWIPSSDVNVVGATTNQQSNLLFAPAFVRVSITAGTGSITAYLLQSSNGPA